MPRRYTQTWLQRGVPVQLFAFSSGKLPPPRVCDGCAHRIATTAATNPPPLPLKLNSAPGLSEVRFPDSFLTHVVSKQRGAGQARGRCKSGFLTRGRAPQSGDTPLLFAAFKGHDAVVRVLVEAGADVTAKNKVSERRVGGDGHMLGERRGFRNGDSLRVSHNHLLGMHDCLRSPTDATCKRSAHQRADVQGLLLHRRRRAGFWVCCVFWCVG